MAALKRHLGPFDAVLIASLLFQTLALGQGEHQPFKGFPDFGHLPPPSVYDGVVFKLSQDYPKSPPPPSELPQFLGIDVTKDSAKYLAAAWKYASEGNIKADWRIEYNEVRKWYHVPWQHYGPYGREGIHGLTKEVNIAKFTMAPTQFDDFYQVYAVGMYNAFGGYTIGQVWKDPMNPNPTATDSRWKGGFPVGTVVVKLLFTDAPADQIPYLKNGIEWDAYITPTFAEQKQRAIQKVRLVQVDLMVRDDRVNESGGWVFGTFVYNGSLGKSDPWENLVPVGVQWGQDPDVKSGGVNPAPTKTTINPALKQTKILESNNLPSQHLGWGMRLSGPVDNVASSCYSCHATAQYPVFSAMSPLYILPPQKIPAMGDNDWMRWFANVGCATPFDDGAISTDFSLQLALGIQNFWQWKNRGIEGFWNEEYDHLGGFPVRR